jgi:hypothetical protein
MSMSVNRQLQLVVVRQLLLGCPATSARSVLSKQASDSATAAVPRPVIAHSLPCQAASSIVQAAASIPAVCDHAHDSRRHTVSRIELSSTGR